MTDQELIDATLRGDRDAFGVVIHRYQRMVEAAAYGATGRHDLVDDVVQDTFVSAWRTIDRLRDGAALRPWLYGIARNLGLKARRRAGRAPALDEVAAAPDPRASLIERERDAEVAKALARLPKRYRDPLVLFYYEQCSVREVADALAMQETAAMQRLSRGRRKLGEALATRVETALESRASRAAAVPAILLLLPERAGAAVSGASSATAGSSAVIEDHTGATGGASSAKLAWLGAHWRPIGGVVGAAAATAVLVAGVSRSNEVHARDLARAAASATDGVAAPDRAAPERPSLPEPEHDHRLVVTSPFEPKIDDPEHVYRALALSADTVRNTCARGVRTLAMMAFKNDAIHITAGEAYWEPTTEFSAMIHRAGEASAGSCGGDEWPEVYVVCEGTIADIQNGTVNCYPFDVFHDS